MASVASPGSRTGPVTPSDAESALARLGYAKIPPVLPRAAPPPEFWVQESGVPRRAFPVFLGADREADGKARYADWFSPSRTASEARAIVVVPSDRAAREAWEVVQSEARAALGNELAILVVPKPAPAGRPHWHRGILPPRALLRLATGVVVGLYRRAQAMEGASVVDFSEMLEILKERFHVDVAGSLGVASDEDALFLLYQLAQRDSFAPGESAGMIHLLVLKPTGPAARLPWFAG